MLFSGCKSCAWNDFYGSLYFCQFELRNSSSSFFLPTFQFSPIFDNISLLRSIWKNFNRWSIGSFIGFLKIPGIFCRTREVTFWRVPKDEYLTFMWVYTKRNVFEILLNQTEIRLYLSFSNRFWTKRSSVWLQINRKIVNTIWFRFDFIRFRKYFSVCGYKFLCSSYRAHLTH